MEDPCVGVELRSRNGHGGTNFRDWHDCPGVSDSAHYGPATVEITFIFIGQTRLVFGKCVCTCVTKHSNAFQTWLKNSKRVWHEPKLHISFASFRKF